MFTDPIWILSHTRKETSGNPKEPQLLNLSTSQLPTLWFQPVYPPLGLGIPSYQRPPFSASSELPRQFLREAVVEQLVANISGLPTESREACPVSRPPWWFWWFGGLVVWWFGGLVVWWFGGLVVWWCSGVVWHFAPLERGFLLFRRQHRWNGKPKVWACFFGSPPAQWF